MRIMFESDPLSITYVIGFLVIGYAVIRVFEACAAAYIKSKEKK